MKNFWIIFLILLCGILTWTIIKGPAKSDSEQSSISKAAKQKVAMDVENINKKVNRDGFETALIEDAKQAIRSEDDLTDSSRLELDSIKKLLKIKDKQLLSYTQVATRTIDSLMKARNYGDTLFKHDGEFAKMSFNLPRQTFSLQYDAKVNMAEYWKRERFLGPKRRYLEIWMADTAASINGVKRLRVEPKQDNFALKVKGIADYNGKHQEIYMGGGVEIETRRFDYQGTYLYDFNTNRWYPGFSVGFKLLEF